MSISSLTLGDIARGFTHTIADTAESIGHILKPDGDDRFYESLKFGGYFIDAFNALRQVPSQSAIMIASTFDRTKALLDSARIFGSISYILPTKDTSTVIYRDSQGKVVKADERQAGEKYTASYGRSTELVRDLRNFRLFKMLAQMQCFLVLDPLAPIHFLKLHGVQSADRAFAGLSQIAERMGQIEIYDARPFEFMNKISLETFCRGTFISIMTFFTLHNLHDLYKLSKYNTKGQQSVKDEDIQATFSEGNARVRKAKITAMLSAASSVSEVGLQILSFYVGGIALAAAGLAKTTIGLTSAYYKTPQFAVPIHVAPGG